LTVGAMMERAEKFFPKKEVISKTHDHLHRLNYLQIGKRTRRLMSVLHELGVQKGDRVGTLAWNHHRHLEIYFAAPIIASVLHTIIIRLSSYHISYLITLAEANVLFIDEDILPLIENILDALKTVIAFIVMSDVDERPVSTLH